MEIPSPAMDVLLKDACTRDRKTARRVALLRILLGERYLTRQRLMARVEGLLGKGCFGESAWEDTFFRDMRVVKLALRAAGFDPAYSRDPKQPGYYLRNQPSIDAGLSAAIYGAIAQVDETQLAVFKCLSPSQRFRQGCSISNFATRVVAHRIREREPHLREPESQRPAVEPGGNDA